MSCFFKTDTRGSVELTDDDTFSAIDDKSPPVRHQRDITERDGFMKYGIFHLQVKINTEGSGLGNTILDAINDIFLGWRNSI